MRYLCILMLCFTVGCSAARTSVDSSNALLKPPIYEGTLDVIHEIAYMAAKHAFPETNDIFKKDDGKVIIERDWFWRGDTIIEVWVKQFNENKCIVEAESNANWHRGNGTLGDVSTGELIYYLSTLKLEYENYKKQKESNAAPTNIMNKLQELKNVYENELITEKEYVEKKKLILDGF